MSEVLREKPEMSDQSNSLNLLTRQVQSCENQRLKIAFSGGNVSLSRNIPGVRLKHVILLVT